MSHGIVFLMRYRCRAIEMKINITETYTYNGE